MSMKLIVLVVSLVSFSNLALASNSIKSAACKKSAKTAVLKKMGKAKPKHASVSFDYDITPGVIQITVTDADDDYAGYDIYDVTVNSASANCDVVKIEKGDSGY